MKKTDWLLFAAILLGFCIAAFGQDRPVSQAFYFNISTAVSGGTFTNADSAPTWTLIKNGSTPVTTGTFTVAGTGTLAADYYGSLTLNSGSWTVGDTYAIEATGTISSVPVKSIVHQGFVLPAWPALGTPAVFANGGTTSTVTTVTNAPSDSSGVTTLLSRLTSARAGYLDSLQIFGSQYVRSGTAQNGGANTITLDSGASSTNSIYVTLLCRITGGTGAGQKEIVTAYNGGTKVATVANAWVTPPDNTSTFDLVELTPVNVAQVGISTANGPSRVVSPGSASTINFLAGSVGTSTYAGGDTSGVATLLTRIPSALTLTGGKVDVNDKTGFSLAVAPPTASAIAAAVRDVSNAAPAAGSLGEAARNADAKASIIQAKTDQMTFTIANKLDVNVLSWVGVDQPPPNLDGYPLVNTLLITDSAAQSIFATQTSVLTVDGSIGKQLVDNVDVAISSRLSTVGYTAPNNAGITAIKTNTDALGTAMELDGLVYRFTANALEQAPATGMTTDQFTLLKKIAKRNGIEP